MIQGHLKAVQSVLKGSLKAVSKKFGGSFKESVCVFQENLKKKASKVLQECFNEVLFDEFVVEWISSQLPEQKEGFFVIGQEFSIISQGYSPRCISHMGMGTLCCILICNGNMVKPMTQSSCIRAL